VFRVFVFIILCAFNSSQAYGQLSHYRDDDNSRVEEFARAYRFCKVIIADNPHSNPSSPIKTNELAECAVDISLRELGRVGLDDYDCLQSIGDEWSDLLSLLKEKKISDTGVALHLRSFVLNYVDKCELDEGRPD
jgi:hypothetical protein